MFLNQHRLDYWVKTHTGTVFTPTALFTAGVTGAWYNPADHTTTFQDTAGTVPANADGQPVQRINDLSGNGHHLLNISGGGNPEILHTSGGLWWISFTTDVLQASFAFVQPITRIGAARVVTYFNSSTLYDGGILNGGGRLYESGSAPEITSNAGTPFIVNATEMTVGVDHVTTEILDGASSKLAVDNNAYGTCSSDTGFNNAAGITVGASGDGIRAADMRWYGGIFIGVTLAAGDIANCRTYFGALAGLTL